MSHLTEAGWLSGIQHQPSPNFNARPAAVTIDLLVLHAISLPPGQFGGSAITDLFLNRLDLSAHASFAALENLQVSSHFLIRRDGDVIQYVSTEARAWHAGKSSFLGRENCNDYSIGVELEGTASDVFTALQYQALVDLTITLQSRYPAITMERITGHQHIAPGRKWDPGPQFDWSFYRKELTDVHRKNC